MVIPSEEKDFTSVYKHYYNERTPRSIGYNYSKYHSVIKRDKDVLESGQHLDIGLLDVVDNVFISTRKIFLGEIEHSIFLKYRPEDEPDKYPYSLIGTSFSAADVQILVDRGDLTKLHFSPSLILRKAFDARINGVPVPTGKHRLASADCISFHRGFKQRSRDGRTNELVPAIIFRPGCDKTDVEDTINPYKFIKPVGDNEFVTINTPGTLTLSFAN